MKFSHNGINKVCSNICFSLSVYSIVLWTGLIFIANMNMAVSYANTSDSSPLEKNISALEMRLFAHDYSQDPLDKRIDRLEDLVYGATKAGSQQERIAGLLQTVPDLTEDSAKSDDASETPPASDSSLAKTDNSKEDKAASEGNNNLDDKNPSDSSYPAVTDLEQKILGHSYENLAITTRLNQLETKAFGKPSQSNDLSERVDLLKQYSSPKDMQNDDNLITEEPPVKWGAHPPGLTQQVGLMEKQVFGKVYGKDKLPSRLHRLEKKVFPGQAPETFAPITGRISRLQVALKPQRSGTNYNTAQSAPSSNFSQSPSTGAIVPFNSPNFSTNNSSEQSSASGNYGSDTLSSTTNNPPTKHHHSLLGKIGQVAGAAGSVALKSMGSMNSGYGYGGYPGYGYGGYPGYGSGYGYSPYGMGSSSMYGYGSSPFGSSFGMTQF